MDLDNYIIEARRQLSDTAYYKPIPVPIAPANVQKIKSILYALHKQKFINNFELKILLPPDNFNTRSIYFLPKIHKKITDWTIPYKMPKARPIVSDVGSESYPVSIYLESFLFPLTCTHPAYIKNSTDLINKIKSISLPSNAILFSLDVESLYTNMNLNRTLSLVKNHFLVHNIDINRPSNLLIDLLDIVLFNNDFKFMNDYFLQIKGIPMGKSCSTSLANLYLQYIDNKILNATPIAPLFYFRYIDDIIGAWPGSLESLIEFHSWINTLIPGIKLSLVHDLHSIDFLDLTFFKSIPENNLVSILYKPFFKSTTTFSYVHNSSFHPSHTFKGIAYSQILRLKRNSLTYLDYLLATDKMFSRLTHRGYRRKKLVKLREEVWCDPGTPRIRNTTHPNPTSFIKPLTLKYNPIHSKLLTLVSDITRKYNITQHISFIKVFTNNKNLRNLLISKKFP